MDKDTTIKFDRTLRKKVQEFLNKNSNKIKYGNPKRFIELATLEKLQQLERVK